MKVWPFILFLALSYSYSCQDFVKVDISDKQPRVGDLFSITCTLKNQNFPREEVDSLTYYPAKFLSSDSSKHQTAYKGIEIIEAKDSNYISEGDSISQRIYSVIAWDSCELVLEGFEYLIGGKTIKSEKVYLKVSLYEIVEGIELYDIKELFSNWKSRTNGSKVKFWIFIGVIIVMVLGATIAFLKRYFTRKIERDHKLPLDERVLLEIDRLYAEELWLHDKLQEHFVRFSYLLRSYLTERFELSFLDKTTFQSKTLLKKIDLPESLRIKIVELLTSSDYIKFADSSMSNERIALLKIAVTNIIEETTPKNDQEHD